ncbi:MAG: hypothetical protein ABSA48_11030 [Terracidiphilus sp.]|jgi:hypothetical protein
MNISGVSSSSLSQTIISLLTNTTQMTYQSVAQQLADSQTISSDPDVRVTLGTSMAESDYSDPMQQAWTALGKSLASSLDPGAMVFGAGTGDLSAAKTALDTYMQLLPSSSMYMSTLTTPSQAFLNDLSAMKTAINSGDLTGAQTAFATALADSPDDIGGAFSIANCTGDTDNMARLSMESAANLSDYLTSIGYTQTNANIEANAMELGSLTENPLVTTTQDKAQEAQAAQQTTEIVSVDSAGASTSNQLLATAETSMYKVYDAIFNADPFGIKNSDPNLYNLRDAVLNQLEGALSGQSSGDALSTTASSVSLSA